MSARLCFAGCVCLACLAAATITGEGGTQHSVVSTPSRHSGTRLLAYERDYWPTTTTTTTTIAPRTTLLPRAHRGAPRPTAAPAPVVPAGPVQQAICDKFGPYCTKAIKVSGCESGWNPAAHNYNPATKDDSWGVFQINMWGDLGPARRVKYGLSSNADLLDLDTNLRVAFDMSGGGRNFGAWSCG